MIEKRTLGVKERYNTLQGSFSVFQCLLLLPNLGVKNIFNSRLSSVKVLMNTQKVVSYRFISNPSVTWRKALGSISSQWWNKIRMRPDSHCEGTCFIIDDTDFHKTGKSKENISRVFSHLDPRCILGFKCLLRAVTDRKSSLLLDFTLVEETVKNGRHGLSDKEIARRKKFGHESNRYKKKEDEHRMSKIELTKQMIGSQLNSNTYGLITGILLEELKISVPSIFINFAKTDLP